MILVVVFAQVVTQSNASDEIYPFMYCHSIIGLVGISSRG